MTVYQPGQRVMLIHAGDPHTMLQPGYTGTVRRHDPQLHTVDVDWDSGFRQSMCLDAGDRIQPLHDTTPATHVASTVASSTDTGRWETTLASLRTAGTDAGRGAADWWAQDTIGARATGDVRATARKILTGIEDGDPEVLEGLPSLDLSGQWADTPSEADLYHAATGHDAPHWQTLDDDQREEAIDAYRDAYDTAALDRVTELCHLAASPTGRDVSHLHPDRVRVGSVGVFSGDWAWTTGADGSHRVAVGFVGTLIDRWNGWAVFSCTRAVAEAIVADQHDHRDELRASLRRQGVPEQELDRRVDAEMTELRFDGEVIVADQRAMYDDPEAIERITPDGDGRYVVMGWNWCWEPVDPYACDRIVGDLPDPCRE